MINFEDFVKEIKKEILIKQDEFVCLTKEQIEEKVVEVINSVFREKTNKNEDLVIEVKVDFVNKPKGEKNGIHYIETEIIINWADILPIWNDFKFRVELAKEE